MPEIDFEALKEKNDDFCAWLVIPALEVNYPVVWCGDNDTYLTKTFEGGTNSAGCLFVDGANSPDLTDRNTLIYGHNMKNGAMFGTLSDFLQKEELAAEDPYFLSVYGRPCDALSDHRILYDCRGQQYIYLPEYG